MNESANAVNNAQEAMERGRYVFFDTETTGLKPEEGHRIVEIGAVEVIDRQITGNMYHCLVNPERNSDPRAIEVHGHSDESLLDKPLFSAIYNEMAAFFDGAILVAHNASFDIGFLNAEMARLRGEKELAHDRWSFIDSLDVARRLHPGQQNSLDALCRRYQIDLSRREKHGALIDSELLAEAYIAMTSFQMSVLGSTEQNNNSTLSGGGAAAAKSSGFLPIPKSTRTINTNADDINRHREFLQQEVNSDSPFGIW